MLADHQIKFEIENSGDIYLTPYDPALVQPASIDLRLGSEFICYRRTSEPVDPEVPEKLEKFTVSEKLILYPGDFVLGTTVEWIGVGSGIGAQVNGKSTLGRLGLIIHSTAGFVDPGFKGNITLEMTNINCRPILLRPGMKIAQIAFFKMDAKAKVPYGHEALGSHYHNQAGVTPAASLVQNL